MLVSWNVTNSCNLYCKHCYRDAHRAAANELTTPEGINLINEIAQAGFRIMIFSGGEPLMRPDIYDLIRQAKKLGLRPVLGTNGTLIDGQTAQKLKKAGVQVAGISLDSLNMALHDDFRAVPGSWQAAVNGMRACLKEGLSFQIHTTVMDWNSHEIEDLTDFALKMGAVAHHIFFLVPAGRGVNIEETTLRATQYEELLGRILKKQQEVPLELKPTCAPQFMRLAKQMGLNLRFSKGCLAGISYCLVNPRGDVQPCAYLELAVGNVLKKPFNLIWRDSPVLQRLRTQDYQGGCGKCAYRKICGGCRARAYFYHGDYMAEEPWCLYRSQGNTTSV